MMFHSPLRCCARVQPANADNLIALLPDEASAFAARGTALFDDARQRPFVERMLASERLLQTATESAMK